MFAGDNLKYELVKLVRKGDLSEDGYTDDSNYSNIQPTKFKELSNLPVIKWGEESCIFEIPLFCFEDVYFHYGLKLFSNDFSLLVFLSDLQLDSLGISAYLQYTYQIAPFTIHNDISKLELGHRYEFNFETEKLSKGIYTEFSPPPSELREEDIDQDFIYLNELKSYDKVGVYFSGGVDSCYLLKNFLDDKGKLELFNCSFGPEDQEAVLAKNIADELGIRIHQFEFTNNYLDHFLSSLSKDYTSPFVDLSAIPTHYLTVKTSEIISNTVVLDGSGADASHAMVDRHTRWNKLRSLSKLPLYLLSKLYQSTSYHLYPAEGGISMLEKFGRNAKNLINEEITTASIKSNGLANMMYPLSSGDQKQISQAINRPLEIFFDCDPITKLSLIAMSRCAMTMVRKSYEPGLNRGLETVYPFMDHGIYAKSLRFSWKEKNHPVTKSLLKSSNESFIPKKWIYRAKSGFRPPIERIFAEPMIQAYFMDEILSTNGYLYPFINVKAVSKLFIIKDKPFSYTVYHLLMALLFLHTWLKQLKK